MRRVVACALALLAVAVAAAPAGAVVQRTTLVDVEQQVMCVTCQIPLQEAESPAADQERAFIQRLVAKGETLAQIKRALVASYTSAVLAMPPASGFNVAVYVVPIAAVVAGLLLAVVLLPRWRRRRGGRSAPAEAAPLGAADAARLDAELARFER